MATVGKIRPKAENFCGFAFWCSKSLGQRYGNALKTWFLQRKPRFPSVYLKKIRLRRATLPEIIQIIDDVQNNYSTVIM